MDAFDIFLTAFVHPLKDMFSTVLDFVPTVVCVFLILLLGHLLAKLLHQCLMWLFKTMEMDKILDKLELSKMLKVAGIKQAASQVIAGVVSLIIVLIFFVMALSMSGIETTSALLRGLFEYVPHVVCAVFVLLMGHVIARVLGRIVMLVVSNLGLPNPKLHERVARWAVLIYAIKMSLFELGFGFLFYGKEFYIWFSGVVLALALSFGMAGRDHAAKFLSRK